MAKTLSPLARSRIMSRIRSRNTTPELAVRSFLHRKGFRFRVHRRGLPGSPDIVLPKHKAVVFVHGCFWHQHAGCRFKGVRIPSANQTYWKPKLERNVSRDATNQAALNELGWRVRVVWECEIETTLLNRLVDWIRAKSAIEQLNNQGRALKRISAGDPRAACRQSERLSRSDQMSRATKRSRGRIENEPR